MVSSPTGSFPRHRNSPRLPCGAVPWPGSHTQVGGHTVVSGFLLQTYSQLAHPIQQAKALGLQFHSRILDIDNIDVSASSGGPGGPQGGQGCFSELRSAGRVELPLPGGVPVLGLSDLQGPFQWKVSTVLLSGILRQVVAQGVLLPRPRVP